MKGPEKGRLGALGAAAVVGFAVICCAGAPLVLGGIVGIGLGGALGGLGGALVVAGAVVGLIVVRRARARRRPNASAAANCCAALDPKPLSRRRERIR